MTPLRPTMVLLVLLGACGRRPHESPAIEPIARPAVMVAADVPATVDAPATVEAPATVDAPAAPHVDAVLLRGLADGSIDLAAHVDSARGVVFATYIEATPDGRTPARRSNRRLCGAAIGRDAALRSRLRDAVAQTAGDGPACGEEECVVPGMEYQAAYHVRFGRASDGTRVLLGVTQQSEAALGEEWLTAMRTYVERAFATASARPCPR